MRIHNQASNQSNYVQNQYRLDKAHGAQNAAQQPSAVAGSSELSRAVSEQSALLAQLRSEPEIRQDLVATVKERIKSGDYLTREAADKTARALLG